MMDGMPTIEDLAVGKTHREMERLPMGLERAAHYLAYGLFVQGDHHKQWFIERALESLGVDMMALRAACADEGCSIEEGIAP